MTDPTLIRVGFDLATLTYVGVENEGAVGRFRLDVPGMQVTHDLPAGSAVEFRDDHGNVVRAWHDGKQAHVDLAGEGMQRVIEAARVSPLVRDPLSELYDRVAAMHLALDTDDAPT